MHETQRRSATTPEDETRRRDAPGTSEHEPQENPSEGSARETQERPSGSSEREPQGASADVSDAQPPGPTQRTTDSDSSNRAEGTHPFACPCEKFAGQIPLAGRVISWQATLLELEVERVLLAEPPTDAPAPGTRVLGVFSGNLPCVGNYVPEPGARVLAYVVDEDFPTICCDGCSQRCSPRGPDAGEGVYMQTAAEALAHDLCLSRCQPPAREACMAERAELPIAGRVYIGPLGDSSAVLGHVATEDLALASKGFDAGVRPERPQYDREFEVSFDQLEEIYTGGAACSGGPLVYWLETLSTEVRGLDAGTGWDFVLLPRGSTWNWRPSCPDSR